MTDATIVLGNVDDVTHLHGLWLELHHHHQEVAPQSGAFVDDDASWDVRASNYADWLDDGRSFLLLADKRGQLVGYAAVRISPSGPELRDTWSVPNFIAALSTLIVAEEERGAGLGTRLLDAVDAELQARGIEALAVGLIPGNEGARRLYESRGFRPRWLMLARQ